MYSLAYGNRMLPFLYATMKTDVLANTIRLHKNYAIIHECKKINMASPLPFRKIPRFAVDSRISAAKHNIAVRV